MKAVFVGGGSLRLLGILREALSDPRIFGDGEIYLHDLNAARAEAMGRMVMQTPEYARCRPTIRWGDSLDAALEGADVVSVILMAGTLGCYRHGAEICRRQGYLSSDNISPNAAFLAIKGGQILLRIARKMEQLCPKAWLLDFANPISVLSGVVNHYTSIRAMGVCQGFTNHQWDLSRLLGKDEQCTDFHVETAGVNHMSFINRGTLHGKDLFKMLDRRLKTGWKPPRLKAHWGEASRANIQNSVLRLAELYHKFGVLLFSTEPEGLWHLRYEEALADDLKRNPVRSRAEIEKRLKAERASRAQKDQHFHSFVGRDLNDTAWRKLAEKDDTFRRTTHDVIVRILRGVAGVEPVRIVTSRPNSGVVAGFKDRTVLEYSQILHRDTVRPEGSYALPDVVQGIVGALASHQMLLVDAIGANDPRTFAHALMSYPVRAYSDASRRLFRDLLKLNADELPPAFRRTADFF